MASIYRSYGYACTLASGMRTRFGRNASCLASSFSRKFSTSPLSFQGNRVLVTMHIPKVGIDLMKEAGLDVNYRDEDYPLKEEELAEKIKGHHGIVCTLEDKITSRVIEAGQKSGLKAISTMSVGFDHVDVKYSAKAGIPVGNTPRVLTDTTAELAIALLLSVSRRLAEGVDAVKTGKWGCWKSEWLCGPSLQGSTVGIVGLGEIGAAFASRLRGFGVQRVIYSGSREKPADKTNFGDFKAEYVSFDTLLQESDFISVHCPLNEGTKLLFNESAFNKMKPNAIFINTSRGGVVDQDALYKALVEKKILAAGLDVTSPEPLPVNHPLLTLPNATILPHIGSASYKTRNAMATLAARNVIAALKGEKMVHVVPGSS